MKKSLYLKLILGYLLFGLLGFLIIALVSSHLTYRWLTNYHAERLYDEASLMADTYITNFNSKDDVEGTVSTQLQLVANFLSSQIWLLDDDGTVLYDTEQRFDEEKISGFSPAGTAERYTIGRFYGCFSEDVLSVYAPISQGYRTTGYLVIHMPVSEITKGTDSILNIVYLTGGILYLLSFLILLIFHVTVYIPLRRITDGAREYASGNLSYHIANDNVHDEMGYLSSTLNYMASELSKLEDYQKSFIANVSHDFRSPLTSIRGYLEAILDGTIPPELHGKYLQRVIAETDRLNKLTEGMLTLNSLDSKGFLTRSSFDINRVIKETCAANEGICGEKGISFELTFADETEFVYADYGKIQQVLYNLIDNAIKFSDQGATIDISTTVRQKKVFVSVKDTGCGIPKDKLKKIWDRFYKGDSSRGKDKKGSGLGLAIVKEIIQAHGETIDVISTEKVGSEFIFSVPLAED